MTRYIFVTGGVVSGLGKGITAASLGRLLKARGLKVSAQKFDPYMNVDPGRMSPFQHGEVFVTEDGAETDLDLGHYERFIDENLNRFSSLTSGRLYLTVLEKERRGEYLGETVQIIPHVTNQIKEFIKKAAQATEADVLITEIGGTVGDIESQPFMEAIRQLSIEIGRQNCLFVHVTLVPFLQASGEHKSKPTQHSVKELRSLGIVPDIIVTRVDEPLDEDLRRKISMFCDVQPDCVIENQTLSCLYEAPLMLHKEGLDRVACRALRLETPEPDLTAWTDMVKRIRAVHRSVRIAIVGKYIKLHDAYHSVVEALSHAGHACQTSVEILWVESDDICSDNVCDVLGKCAGILVPGGFGEPCTDGMLAAVQYAREQHIPYFGVCVGMQAAAIEFARNVLGLAGANAESFDKDAAHCIFKTIPDAPGAEQAGGAMRLGAYPMQVTEGSVLHRAYGETTVSERHRHSAAFSIQYKERMEAAGLCFAAQSGDGERMEALELSDEPFYVGVLYHPEYKSRPNRAHPLYIGFVMAALKEDANRGPQNAQGG